MPSENTEAAAMDGQEQPDPNSVKPTASDVPGDPAADVRRKVASGVVVLALRDGAVRLLGLLANLALARLLTPREFGIAAFGFTITAFGSFVADGGIAATLVQREAVPTERDLRAMLGFHLSVMTVSLLLITAVGVPLGEPGQVAAVMAISLPLDALAVPSSIMLERDMAYRGFVWSDLIQMLVYNTVAVGLVIAGLGVWGIAISVPMRALTGSVVLIRLGPAGWQRPLLSLAAVKPYLAFGVRFQAANVLNTVRDQGLNIVTASIGGLAVLGVWSLVMRVMQAIFLVLNSLWRVSFPAVARLAETGEPLPPVLERALRLSSVAIGLLTATVGGTAPVLIPVFFGSRWNGAVPTLAWCAGAVLTSGAISVTATGYLYATDRPGVPLRAVALHTVVWFAVSVPLIPHFHAQALGMGGYASTLVDVVVLGRALRRDGVRLLGNIVPDQIIASVSGVTAWTVAKHLGENFPSLIASGLCAVLLYFTGAFVFRRRTVGDLSRLVLRAVKSSP